MKTFVEVYQIKIAEWKAFAVFLWIFAERLHRVKISYVLKCLLGFIFQMQADLLPVITFVSIV